jgi:hypothetical protein
MSSEEKRFSIRLRIGNNEIEISGNHEDVMNAFQNISELVSKTSDAFGQAPHQPATQYIEPPQQNVVEESFPSISIDPATPCPDAIVQILSTDWGKREPRTLGELLAAMKVNAIHYPEGTVKGRLTDLTKRGVLRRISSRKGYEYILIKP